MPPAIVGELFEYRFSAPVTVKKDESAMLPFLQQPIGARKLLIYSENYGEHPMNAAELTNSTVQDAGWRARSPCSTPPATPAKP